MLVNRMKIPKSNFRESDAASLSYTMEDVLPLESIYDWTDFKIGAYISVVGIEDTNFRCR